MKTALIAGVAGQDGGYLANHLPGLGYQAIGASCDTDNSQWHNLTALGVEAQDTIALMNSAVSTAARLDPRDHVETDPSPYRPSELMRSVGSPARAGAELGWQPRVLWPDVAHSLVEAELQAAAQTRP